MCSNVRDARTRQPHDTIDTSRIVDLWGKPALFLASLHTAHITFFAFIYRAVSQAKISLQCSNEI